MDNLYSGVLTDQDAQQLCARLSVSPAFCPQQREHALFCFQGMDATVTYFPKRRRLVVQGRGTQDFLRLMLPEALSTTHDNAQSTSTSPHFGVDESGKGDYFGPLVVAGVYADAQLEEPLRRIGCRDSKLIDSDAQIARMAEQIKILPGIAFEILCIGPSRYNELYAQTGNLNKLLAWGHARVIAALHAKVPACPRALSDQFANERVLRRALDQYHLPVQLEQHPHAEQDIAVAAASILARARFVDWMNKASCAAKCDLPLGCAPHVLDAARRFVTVHGADRLRDVAKLHFKLTKQLPQPPPDQHSGRDSNAGHQA